MNSSQFSARFNLLGIRSISILFLLLLLPQTSAILPTMQIISSSSSPIYAATSFYGPIDASSSSLSSSQTPPNDRGLCSDLDDPITDYDPPTNDFVFLVPRGNCTFEHKTLRAERYGAKAVIVYNNAEQMFFDNHTESQQTGLVSSFPTNLVDYECSNGEAQVPLSSLSTPYYSRSNDPLFTSCSSNSKCESNRCVVTGSIKTSSSPSSPTMQVCCMWDLHQYLYPDSTLLDSPPTIPSVFITSKQYDEGLPLTLSISPRPRPKYNASSFLIWAWGCFVACLASRTSGSELARALKKTKEKLRRGSGATRTPSETSSSDDDMRREDDIGAGESMELNAKVRQKPACLRHNPFVINYVSNSSLRSASFAQHAIGFLVMSSVTLLILFYLNIYAIVTVLYAFGCSGALSQVMIYPFMRKVRGWTNYTKFDEVRERRSDSWRPIQRF
ncbi:hypothetical protein TL16_g11734 [Triparma laevis f. inornata]|uniref:PA domain-containing protein n=1 Tax=Triparma laevis f. inornata TaxID=1714386 RepID=A0A9W7BH44_9STRA|nr:hypothetical protein TL16_g11734 [Triparma laevis f. inornata]